jgi:hypothetical protein
MEESLEEYPSPKPLSLRGRGAKKREAQITSLLFPLAP